MKRFFSSSTSWLLLFIAVASMVLDYFTPAMGDDLLFWNFLGLHDYTMPNRRTISFILAHIFGCNGRIFDFLGPIIIYLLPRGLAAMVMGAMYWLMFKAMLMVAKVPDKRHAAFGAAFLAISIVVFPWYDAMWMRVIQFNYSWALLFCLLFVHYWYTPGNRNALLMFLLGAVAAAVHEQAAVAMCGMFVPLAWFSRPLSRAQRFLLIGLICGAALPLGAPAIWLRVSAAEPQLGPLATILTTIPIYVLLLIVIAIMSVGRRGRATLNALSRQSWIACVGVGGLAAIVAVYSGIPGRTGCLSEGFALVALTQMALRVKFKLHRVPAALIYLVSAAFIATHYCVSIQWQRRGYQEYMQAVSQFQSSADGIVYLDVNVNRYAPHPVTLYRVKGIPDADDIWQNKAIAEAYGDTTVCPIVVPEFFKGKIAAMTDSLEHNGVTVYDKFPCGVIMTSEGIMFQNYDGVSPRVINHARLADGRDVWIATPWIRDVSDVPLPAIRTL